jgi:ubiquinone/menaquinone biosynthesis C-methylase UbiE
MAAAYDTYDYPSYWEGRKYEHEAEIVAIKSFLENIPSIKRVVEIGAGFGRLTSSYIYRANKVALVDPSSRLLKLARKQFKQKKVDFIQSTIENLPKKIRANSADVVILVRVLHHIDDVDKAFLIAEKILSKNGYFMLEFANKRHSKAMISQFIRGNFTFLLDIFPVDIRSKKHKKQKTLPFINYHPDIIEEKLKKAGFETIERRSVSNIRSPFIKKILPFETLMFFEKYTQKALARLNFGPSIFILAKK